MKTSKTPSFVSRKGYTCTLAPAQRLTDWHGNPLSPKILPGVGAGHTVRVGLSVFSPGESGPEHEDWVITTYMKITRADKDGWLQGDCNDPNYSYQKTWPVEEGEAFSFQRAHIWEIPTDWPENKNLPHKKPLPAGHPDILQPEDPDAFLPGVVPLDPPPAKKSPERKKS